MHITYYIFENDVPSLKGRMSEIAHARTTGKSDTHEDTHESLSMI